MRWRQFAGADSALGGPGAVPPPVPTPTRATFPPGVLSAYTLSGVVFEVTTTGETPIEGVAVYCELCGEETHSWSITDSSGIYRFTGVWTTPGVPTPVWFGKEGYIDPLGVYAMIRLSTSTGRRRHAVRR